VALDTPLDRRLDTVSMPSIQGFRTKNSSYHNAFARLLLEAFQTRLMCLFFVLFVAAVGWRCHYGLGGRARIRCALGQCTTLQ
jgi:hypothetical protein